MMRSLKRRETGTRPSNPPQSQEMEGRLLHTVTLRDREIRKTTLRIEEADVVARLHTPDIGAKEQVRNLTKTRILT